MSDRKVTELDFRMPEFRDAKVEDYEFRKDGAIVRKDRWETAIYEIASIMGFSSRDGFEIPDVVAKIRNVTLRWENASCLYEVMNDCKSKYAGGLIVRLNDGSILYGASVTLTTNPIPWQWKWREVDITGDMTDGVYCTDSYIDD